jgi:hypothetical protein
MTNIETQNEVGYLFFTGTYKTDLFHDANELIEAYKREVLLRGIKGVRFCGVTERDIWYRLIGIYIDAYKADEETVNQTNNLPPDYKTLVAEELIFDISQEHKLYNPAFDPEVTNGIQEAYGFAVGDVVEYTNSDDVKLGPYTIVGFVQNPDPNFRPDATVYISSDSPWFSVSPSSLNLLIKAKKEFSKEK